MVIYLKGATLRLIPWCDSSVSKGLPDGDYSVCVQHSSAMSLHLFKRTTGELTSLGSQNNNSG